MSVVPADAARASAAWRASLVGASPSLEGLASVVELVAPRRCTVLISGETGTRKRSGGPRHPRG